MRRIEIFFVAVMFCALAATCAQAGVKYHSVAIDGKVMTLEKDAPEIQKEERVVIFPEDFPAEIDKKEVVQALVYGKQDKYIFSKYEISDFSLLTLAAEVEAKDSLVLSYNQEKGEILTSVEPDPGSEEKIGKIKKYFRHVLLVLLLPLAISFIGGALIKLERKKLGLVLAVIGIFSADKLMFVFAHTFADPSINTNVFWAVRILAVAATGILALAGLVAATDTIVVIFALTLAALSAIFLSVALTGVFTDVLPPVPADIIYLKIFAFYFVIFLSEIVIIYLMARKIKKAAK